MTAAAKKAMTNAALFEKPPRIIRRNVTIPSRNSCKTMPSAARAPVKRLTVKVTELEDDPSVPRSAYVSTEAIGEAEGALIGGLVYIGAVAAAGAIVASGGPIAVAIVAAAMTGGAGGLIGSDLAKLVGRHHADHLQEQLRRGGLLLWVRTRDKNHEERAIGVLSKHSAHDVHTHALPEVPV